MSTFATVQHPKLRPLDIRPFEEHGQPYLLLRDPLQLTDATLLVPQPLAATLALCDGTRDTEAISEEFAARYGIYFDPAQIQDMLDRLDEAYMLENRRTDAARKRTLQAYRSEPFRKPALAGPSYPAEPSALRTLLDGYLTHAANHNGMRIESARGLLSPHIDYPRGGSIYAKVWHHAAEAAREADLVVLFGTDHYGTDPFTLTRQHYATPYGVLPTATDVVDALAASIGEDAAYAGELRHRHEHSLELVVTWLHHIRDGEPCELVPILCGGFHAYLHRPGEPADDPLVQRVLQTLHEQIAGRRVLVVASGDLAHVGPAFGGRPLDAAGRRALRAADDELIDAMVAGDAAHFFDSIRRVGDRNNVCGVSPIYLTMHLLEALHGPVTGTQTGYDTCPADAHDTSVVTVGGVVFG